MTDKVNKDIMAQLIEMGFPEVRAEKGLWLTGVGFGSAPRTSVLPADARGLAPILSESLRIFCARCPCIGFDCCCDLHALTCVHSRERLAGERGELACGARRRC